MISKRGSRWRVVVQAPADPLTGARRQLSGSASTEREAVHLERQLRIQAEGGVVASLIQLRVERLQGTWVLADDLALVEVLPHDPDPACVP